MENMRVTQGKEQKNSLSSGSQTDTSSKSRRRMTHPSHMNKIFAYQEYIKQYMKKSEETRTYL